MLLWAQIINTTSQAADMLEQQILIAGTSTVVSNTQPEDHDNQDSSILGYSNYWGLAKQNDTIVQMRVLGRRGDMWMCPYLLQTLQKRPRSWFIVRLLPRIHPQCTWKYIMCVYTWTPQWRNWVFQWHTRTDDPTFSVTNLSKTKSSSRKWRVLVTFQGKNCGHKLPEGRCGQPHNELVKTILLPQYYQWLPIVVSPIGGRTLTKMKIITWGPEQLCL